MAVRVTAAHTAEARAEAGREAGEGGVAAAALAPGGFLGLPAPFGEEGNRAREAGRGRGGGGSAWVDTARRAGAAGAQTLPHLGSSRDSLAFRTFTGLPAGRPPPHAC
jgi:hypothetical protein